ncbi:MAG: autolysin, partial [Staphylococcus epidermidis]|nr:autolysin [Staphylococcus epidermidis]MDU1965812.1 autolysin [Staphylococcus lugdunensis]
MLKNTRLRMTTLFIISILAILAILFLIFDTNLFKNDVKHTFKEAVS